MFGLDVGLYAASVVGTIKAEQVWLKLVFSLATGVMIALLAIIGHDAGHQSFSKFRWLNRLCGTIAFLPALHPFSLWIYHHNSIHHRYTIQLGLDNAFPPMTVVDYQTASPWRRQKYRFLRGLWGQPFFYLIDVWLPCMVAPWLGAQRIPPSKYGMDLVFVYLYLGFYLLLAIGLNQRLHGLGFAGACSVAVLFSLAIPFLLWNAVIAFLSIVQHTAPGIHWMSPSGKPTSVEVGLRSTIHVIFPEWLDRLTHRIMQHPAHHCHEGIPLHQLRSAQSALQASMPETLRVNWSFAYHWRITQTCQLYDTSAQCWRRFADVPIA